MCKFWRQASRASWSNFKKLDLLEKTWGSPKSAITYFSNLKNVISRCGEVITEIDLTDSRAMDNTGFAETLGKLLFLCPNLKKLDVGFVRVGVGFIRKLVIACKNLESLSLGRLKNWCNDLVLGDLLISKLNLRCFHLKLIGNSLNGSCTKNLNPDYIEEISITNCRSIDERLLAEVIILIFLILKKFY